MNARTGLIRSPLAGIVAGSASVATVAAAIALFDNWVPVLSLGVLFVFAVLPIAVFWGTVYAVIVAVASMLTFNFFYLPPVHTLTLADGRNWFALAVYLATAVVVGALAARARRETDEARGRERESAFLADIASELLRGQPLADGPGRVEERAAEVLGVSSVHIATDEFGADSGGIRLPDSEEPELGVRRRVLPALASLLAIARERERLAAEAAEAEALRQSDAIKTAIIQTVSHDLRTPLATIETALGGLEGDSLVLSEADRQGLLETIRAEHSRLKRLVENLLDLSRIQAGAAVPRPELWSADELVWQAIEESGDADRVRVTIPDVVPAARVDAVQVQRVLANLIENALKFSPPEEPVSVTVNATRKELIVRVTDRGAGVRSGDANRVFEPFHRVAGAGDGGGAGLGLAIARGFAEANGGRLWVESRPGQGATFALALPLAPVDMPVGVRA